MLDHTANMGASIKQLPCQEKTPIQRGQTDLILFATWTPKRTFLLIIIVLDTMPCTSPPTFEDSRGRDTLYDPLVSGKREVGAPGVERVHHKLDHPPGRRF